MMFVFLWLVGAVVIFGTHHWALALAGLTVLTLFTSIRSYGAKQRQLDRMRAAHRLEFGRDPVPDLVEVGRMAGGGGLAGLAGAAIGGLINAYQERDLTLVEKQASAVIRDVERRWTVTWFFLIEVSWFVCALVALAGGSH